MPKKGDYSKGESKLNKFKYLKSIGYSNENIMRELNIKKRQFNYYLKGYRYKDKNLKYAYISESKRFNKFAKSETIKERKREREVVKSKKKIFEEEKDFEQKKITPSYYKKELDKEGVYNISYDIYIKIKCIISPQWLKTETHNQTFSRIKFESIEDKDNIIIERVENEVKEYAFISPDECEELEVSYSIIRIIDNYSVLVKENSYYFVIGKS